MGAEAKVSKDAIFWRFKDLWFYCFN